jgi:glycosyltransferase involved in cell wall biosynthesis
VAERILLFSANLPPYGGTAAWVRLWLENMPVGAETDFLFAPRPGARESVISRLRPHELKKSHMMEVSTRHLRNGYLVRVKAALALLRLLLGGQYDLVFPLLNDSEILAYGTVLLARLISGRRVGLVVRCAGYPLPWRRVGSFRGRVLSFLLRRVYGYASQVVAINQAVKSYLKELFDVPDGRIVVSPISVPCSGDGALKERPEGAFQFAIMSRLEPEKGVGDVVEAFARLVREGADAQLHLYGTGSMLKALKEQAMEFGLDGRVFFHGWVENPMAVLAGTDCLILASASEGTPRSILEAGCVGTPTIATDVGGVGEIITHSENGWLFDYGDVHALTVLMREISTMDKERFLDVRRAIKAKIIEDFSLVAETARIARTLRQALSQLCQPLG